MHDRLRDALRFGALASLLAPVALGLGPAGCAADTTSDASDEELGGETVDDPGPVPQAAPTPDAALEVYRPAPELGAWVQTPLGVAHRSCVYDVGDDAEGLEDGSVRRADGSLFAPPACEHTIQKTMSAEPQADGWVIARTSTLGTWMKKESAVFGVPKEPVTQGSQLLYFFPGSENLSGKLEIIQPVLQWGTSPAGGSKSWGIASWYGGAATKGNYFHSKLAAASPGDSITGVVTASSCTSAGACKWTVTTKNDDTGKKTTIISPRLPPQNWVLGGVMEEYGVGHCDQNAGSKITFSSLQVWNKSGKKVSPTWSQDTWGPAKACHSKSSASGASVTLAYDVKRASGDRCTADKQCKSGSCGTCPYYAGICCK